MWQLYGFIPDTFGFILMYHHDIYVHIRLLGILVYHIIPHYLVFYEPFKLN